MTNKIISSVFLTTCIVFFALANANPDNLLFLFVSANPVVAISRIILTAGMVLLSFKSVLSNSYLRQAAMYFGFCLIAFGTLSMAITPLGSAEYNYAKWLDWLVLAEAGIIFTTCALAFRAQSPANLKRTTTLKANPAKLRSRAPKNATLALE